MHTDDPLPNLPSAPSSETPYLDAHGFDPDAYDWVPVLRRKRDDGWTPDRQRRFIEILADVGSVAEAAREVGMSESTAYRLRRSPGAEGFDRAWSAAIEAASKKLIDVAFQRAMVGYDDPVIDKEGTHIYTRTKLSEKLLMFLLSAYMPDRFGAAARQRPAGHMDAGVALPPAAQAIAAMLPQPPAEPHSLLPPDELDVRIEVADMMGDGQLPRWYQEASAFPRPEIPATAASQALPPLDGEPSAAKQKPKRRTRQPRKKTPPIG